MGELRQLREVTASLREKLDVVTVERDRYKAALTVIADNCHGTALRISREALGRKNKERKSDEKGNGLIDIR